MTRTEEHDFIGSTNEVQVVVVAGTMPVARGGQVETVHRDVTAEAVVVTGRMYNYCYYLM